MKICGRDVKLDKWWKFQIKLKQLLEEQDGFISEHAIISESAKIIGNVFIGKKTKIFENAVIKGPAYIGKNCVIGTNSLIREGASIGDNTVIGFSAEVKNSVIGSNTQIGHLCYIGDSLIEDNVTLAMVRICNMRLDRRTIKVYHNNKLLDTGLRKLGAYIKTKSSLGSGVIVLPGRVIGSNTRYGPGIIVDKNRPSNRQYFLEQEIHERGGT